MALTAVLALSLTLTALLGAVRGVRPGLVALWGTLMAAVLVDLWFGPLAAWVREGLRPERPALPIFLLVALAFLLATGVLGYGGSALLPPGSTEDDPGLLERVVGTLLGALNGALVGGYLLHYANVAWAGGGANEALAASGLARLLGAWLPWFMLAAVAATALIILLRLAQGALARSHAHNQSVASAPTLAEADRRLSDKIDQALGKK